jgi:hypothetical protein
MRLRGVKVLLMGGAFLGGLLVSWLKSIAGGDITGVDPGTVLFVVACAGMAVSTIPLLTMQGVVRQHSRI